MTENKTTQPLQFEQPQPMPRRQREYTMPGRVMIDDEWQRRIRRWFGWDFTVVLIVLMMALYFVWPLMFRKQDRYVAESAIRDGYVLIAHLRDFTASQSGAAEEEIIASLQKHPALKAVENELTPRVYILNALGEYKAGNDDFPDYWDAVVMKILPNQRGIEVYATKEISTLFLYDELPGTQCKIVVDVPFRPMFSTK